VKTETTIFIMTDRMNKIRRKKAELTARKIIDQLASIELINFEEENSNWIERFKPVLDQFHKIDSKPIDLISLHEPREAHLKWIHEGFDFLLGKDEWLIVVPNCDEPIWANVSVKDSSNALVSVWDLSESKEFVIANKSSGQIAAVFFEENGYEIHKKIAP
jgi:hypothetical protein